MTTAAIVLAGGASTRFGGDKLAAMDRDVPVLHHALRAAGAVAGPIVLVIAPSAPIPPVPADLEPRIVVARDAVAHQGPLAGLDAGLAALPADARVAILVAGDMPALVPAVLRRLAETLAGDRALAMVTLESDPPSPLPAAVRPADARAATAALLADGRRSLRALAGVIPSLALPAASWRGLDPGALTLRDVDTPADLAPGTGEG